VFKSRLTAGYLAPFVIALAVLSGIILWRLDDQIALNHWVEHTDRVILNAKDTQLALRYVQLSYRAYLQSSDRRYLAELAEAQREFEGALSRVAAAVADNPDQLQRLSKINDLREQWATTIKSLIDRNDHDQFKAEDLVGLRRQADSVFDALGDFIAAENALRAHRASRQAAASRVIFVLVPLLSAVAATFLGYWGWRRIQVAGEQFREALDVAERARAEAENERVETDRARAAAEEAQAEAEEASARAEEASRAKNSFIGTVSHELRNPLNSIMLWSTALLRDPALGEGTRCGLIAIERAAKTQAQLIGDLLDISRIESGRLRLDLQVVDLAEVVKAGVETMRIAAEAKSITLRESYHPRIGSIPCDSGRLQQVVWNLVSNAVKFTPNGGTVQISVERINSHAEIIVADTGRGIEPAALNSVFDRFWQEDGAGESRHGVGLGLSIVNEIVTMHGGTVSANSAGTGKGSTFTVRLPLSATSGSSSNDQGDSIADEIPPAESPEESSRGR
jgi:signal transduction histidine kinase